MGTYDSSKTRVVPIFDRLLLDDPSGQRWTTKLLLLASSGPAITANITLNPNIKAKYWATNPREKPLPAAKSLLRWLVENVNTPKSANAWKLSATAIENRKKLIARDVATIANALAELEKSVAIPAWCILEGNTKPDVYIETPDFILVIEGKRTEPTLTKSTSWMEGRHQMWRHIDCAWEVKRNQRVYGMLIVETDEQARQFANETMNPAAISSSLPHRTTHEQSEISQCFLGATTWKAVCDTFGLPWNQIVDLKAVDFNSALPKQ